MTASPSLTLTRGAVHNRVAFAFAVLVVNHGNRSLAVHDHQIAGFRLDRLHTDEANRAVRLGFQSRLLGDSRCRTTDVEGTHRELRSRLADRLRRDDAGGFAEFDQASRRQVSAVAHDANAAPGFAGQHGANLHSLDAGSLNRARQVFGDFLVDVDDHIAVVVLDLLERNAADDAVTQRLDDFAGFNDSSNVNAIHRAAIVFADDYVLSNVNQTASQVARIGGLQCRIGQSFTRAVRRDEVLQHRQPFAEVRSNRRLDDFARRLRHQTAHSGQLANLLFRSASAGVGHDVNRIDDAFFIALLHLAEHFVSNSFGDSRPDFDDLVIALAVGDGSVQILLLDRNHLLLTIANQGLLVIGNDHVVNPDRQSGSRREAEAEILHFVEHLDRDFETVLQVAEVDQLTNPLLLQQAVDVWHAVGKVIVQDCASNRCVQERAIVAHRISVNDVLIVISGGEVDHLTGVAQTDRRKRLDFSGMQREQNFVDVRERAAFTLGTGLAFRQVVQTEDHVLRRNGDRLS